MNTGVQGPYQRSDGYWCARIEAGYKPNGQRHRPAVVAKDRKTAEARAKKLLAEYRQKGAQAVLGRNITVRTWSKKWTETRIDYLRDKTREGYESAVRTWIVPVIGRRTLGTLRSEDVENVQAAILEAGRSISTANAVTRALKTMLKDAQRYGYYVPESAMLARAASGETSDRAAMTPDEIGRILDVLDAYPNRSRWYFAMMYAPRLSEGLGLCWPKINFEAETITPDTALKEIRYKNRKEQTFYIPKGKENLYVRVKGCQHLSPVKTASREATLPLIPALADELRAWRELAVENPFDLVWTRPDGDPITEAEDREQWYEIQAKAKVQHPSGRPYFEHEIKHTAATLLDSLQVPSRAKIAILGHSSERSSKTYSHAMDADTREALSRLSDKINSSRKKTEREGQLVA